MSLVPLAPEGEPIREARPLELFGTGLSGAAWHGGRHAIATLPGTALHLIEPAPTGFTFASCDACGTPDGSIITVEEDARELGPFAVLHLSHGDRWVIVQVHTEGRIVATSLRRHAIEGRETIVEFDPTRYFGAAPAVALRSRVALITQPGGVESPSRLVAFGWPPTAAGRVEVELPSLEPRDVVAVRDTAVAFLENRERSQRVSVVLDPFEGRILSSSEPWTIAVGGWDAVAADELRGHIGRCFVGLDDGETVYFQLHSHDGTPASDPIRLATPPRTRGCSIAFDGSRYLVAWGDPVDGGVFVQAVAAR